jgi:hypothetical protein
MRPATLGFVLATAFATPAAADEPLLAPRPRWGTGMTAGFEAVGVANTIPNLGVGPYVRLGIEYDDFFGVEGEASLVISPVGGVLRGALLLDLTPTPWLTFATGPMVSYGGAGAGNDILVAGATIRCDFHVISARTPGGTRHGLSLGIGSDLGYGRATDRGTGGLGYGTNLYIGYSQY